jgi:hypothetical protein
MGKLQEDLMIECIKKLKAENADLSARLKAARNHKTRTARIYEKRRDCCGDRYACNVSIVCSCGLKSCRSCMEDHLLKVSRRKL